MTEKTQFSVLPTVNTNFTFFCSNLPSAHVYKYQLQHTESFSPKTNWYKFEIFTKLFFWTPSYTNFKYTGQENRNLQTTLLPQVIKIFSEGSVKKPERVIECTLNIQWNLSDILLQKKTKTTSWEKLVTYAQ